ncbi:DUF6364 family protein [Lentisphaera marina]|uniref:DUF6364 family protein n=1 Tax=Lentisphaera marina TaxID=1111041 RepID=UPI002366689C|nr:DUF6364 family protein [Lentisphaera marina]MDD7986920.1 DUF6364 family protein [Lentisphaera marina]
MDSKLTLKIDDGVIKSAKKFAKLNNTSLSKMTESYFRTITSKSTEVDRTIPGIVGELAGLLKEEDIDYSNSSHIDYLEEKYK